MGRARSLCYPETGNLMHTDEMISVREYLSTSYRPDCDYIDGVVLERNVGEYDHARLQKALLFYFELRRKQWKMEAVPEQRAQVSATRFRVPDVCVMLDGAPRQQIFTTPPFICIEILSPEDRIAAMQERVGDFLRMGVPYVWIVDPRSRQAWHCTANDMLAVTELRTQDPEIVVPIAELFDDEA